VNYAWGYKLIHRAKQGRFLIFISYLIMEAKQTSETLRINKKKRTRRCKTSNLCINVKGKPEVHPSTGHEGPEGE